MRGYQALVVWSFILACSRATGDEVAATYDGAASASISLTVSSELAPPSLAIQKFATLHATGELRYNVSSAEDAVYTKRVRKLMYASLLLRPVN